MSRTLLSLAFAALLVLYLAGSLALKVERYGDQPDVDPQVAAERRVTEFLVERDFLPFGVRPLTSGGSFRELAFTHLGCPEPLRVAVVGADGADASLVHRDADAHLVRYLWQGREYERVPRTAIMIDHLREAALRLLMGRRQSSSMPVLAVTVPGESGSCPIPPPAAWPS